MQALWGEPWTAPSVFVDGNEVAPFRGDVFDLWLLAKQCTVTQWRQGPAERRRNGGTAQGSIKLVHFDVEDSIPRIGCFLSAFEHLFRTLPKELSQSTATEIESWSLDANRRSLVCERRVKKDRTLVKKILIELVSKGSWTPSAVGEETKNRAFAQAPHPFERKSSSIKARRRQSRSTGFARDFGWIVAGTKPSGRTLDLYIYIYIANGESPSQHVTVGLAEARPKKFDWHTKVCAYIVMRGAVTSRVESRRAHSASWRSIYTRSELSFSKQGRSPRGTDGGSMVGRWGSRGLPPKIFLQIVSKWANFDLSWSKVSCNPSLFSHVQSSLLHHPVLSFNTLET